MCFVTTIIVQNEISEQTLHQNESYTADVIEAKLYDVSWTLQIIY